jgi:hypothetical protein
VLLEELAEMPLGDTYKIRLRGTMRGQSVETGFHLTVITGDGDAADAAASVVASVMPLVLAATSVQVNWNEVVASDVRSAEAGGLASVTVPLTQPNPGLVTGDALPNQNAMVIGLRTGRKGGRYNGRMFVPGISEANTLDGVLTGTQLTALGGLANGLISLYGPTGTEGAYRIQIYSPPSPPPPPIKVPKVREGTFKTQVTGHDIDQVVRTQRRRSQGVGS